MIRPRRSMLFMPGSNARALEKARTLTADGLILDLEDAVAPDAKAVARQQIADAVAAKGFGRREIIIRINGLDTPWWIDDIRMAAKAQPDGVMVPKVASVADLKTISDRVADMGGGMHIKIWAMIESPRAVLRAPEIAAAGSEADNRLAGFVIGPNDIARESRIRMVKGRAPMLSLLSSCVIAARAGGIEILDGVYNDFSDLDGFARECEQGRDLGFDGKTLIHPSQIEPCNTAFTPPADEVARARKIAALFDQPENAGKGAVQMDGQMVERMHMEMAKRTIAIADAIAAAG
ncbi:MAG: malyl-CoA thiolesterase [Proteobacteria bacterium SG_bin9]|nr:MAG: malyl-CoA thiolesterase [Proteobacteria bacterium SG_bin9]